MSKLINETDLRAKIKQRHNRYHDEKSFMSRQLLEQDQTAPDAKQRFEETLRVVLATCYPALFTLTNGALRMNSEMSYSSVQAISEALGVNPDDDIMIDRDNFDPVKLNDLYEADKNPLWLVLKHALPVNPERNHSPESKVETCIKLAMAFRDGCATQVEQMGNRVGRDLGLKTDEEAGKIRTPDESKAVQGAYYMAMDALRIAENYPQCTGQVRNTFLALEEQPSRLRGVFSVLGSHESLAHWLNKGHPEFQSELAALTVERHESQSLSPSRVTADTASGSAIQRAQIKVEEEARNLYDKATARHAERFAELEKNLDKAREQTDVFKKKVPKEDETVFGRIFGGKKK
ncbi:MAG: hypothetical protein K0U37_03845 [Gammaproteobacteria bacterium]|nr:hypothetical protein [Gammaproteobacteria bacterium]